LRLTCAEASRRAPGIVQRLFDLFKGALSRDVRKIGPDAASFPADHMATRAGARTVEKLLAGVYISGDWRLCARYPREEAGAEDQGNCS
jgi:hypothetical protein